MVGPENASIRALTRQDGYQTIIILNYHTDPLFSSGQYFIISPGVSGNPLIFG